MGQRPYCVKGKEGKEEEELKINSILNCHFKSAHILFVALRQM